MQDDLRQIDISDGQQHHGQFLHPDATSLVILKALQVGVDLYGLVVGGEECLRLIEGAGVAGRLIAGGLHALVGVGRHIVQRGGLVEVQALHTV